MEAAGVWHIINLNATPTALKPSTPKLKHRITLSGAVLCQGVHVCPSCACLRGMAEASSDVDQQLKAHKDRMVHHMNDDHGDSLLVYAKHYAKLTSAIKAVLTDISSSGLTLDVTLAHEAQQRVFVQFPRPLQAVKDVRPIVVEMHHEAYDALGAFYKMRSGYFKKQMMGKITALTKSTAGKVAVGVAALGALSVGMVMYKRLQSRPAASKP